MKKTLPVRPFFTSRVISALASSTSARTRVDICAVASLTKSPTEGLAGRAFGSTSGIEVTVVGTPVLRSPLLTAVLQLFAVVAVHVAMPRSHRGYPLSCYESCACDQARLPVLGRTVDGGCR